MFETVAPRDDSALREAADLQEPVVPSEAANRQLPAPFLEAVRSRVAECVGGIRAAHEDMLALVSVATTSSWSVDQLNDLMLVFEQLESLCSGPEIRASEAARVRELRLRASESLLQWSSLPLRESSGSGSVVRDDGAVREQIRARYIDLYVYAFARFLEVFLDGELTERQLLKVLGGIEEQTARFGEECLAYADALGIPRLQVLKVKASRALSVVGAVAGGIIDRGMIGRSPLDEAMMGPRGGFIDVFGNAALRPADEVISAASSCIQPFVECLESLGKLCFDVRA